MFLAVWLSFVLFSPFTPHGPWLMNMVDDHVVREGGMMVDDGRAAPV